MVEGLLRAICGVVLFFLFFSFDLRPSTYHLLPFCFAEESAPNPKALFKQADVVLEVIPLRARPIERGVSVDAVESAPERLALAEAVVSFKIRRVLKGEWLKDRVGGPTRLEQLEKAVRKKDYTKILTLNLSDPNQVVAREWLSIAVEDPGKTFGIERWDSPDPTRLKVYFKRQAENKNSFVMIGVVPS